MNDLKQLLRLQVFESLKANAQNILNRYELKCYSQNGEDGIIKEIFRRLPIGDNPIFVEFGVGDGLECNTLQLLFSGWRGYWIGNNKLAFSISPNSRLHYIAGFITIQNLKLIKQQLLDLKTEIDFLSMDFDGNDAYFLNELIELKPKVICTEYNSSVIPPGRFCIDYNDSHVWSGDDYFGASLQYFVDLLKGYKLVCCNLSGCNAFFVREDFGDLFMDVPDDINKIYNPPVYEILKGGHPVSPKTIENILSKPDTFFMHPKR